MRVAPTILAGIFLALVPLLDAHAREGERTYGDLEGVVYLNNYDGDTIRFDLPGIHPLFGENIPVRLRGVDTPEIRSRCPEEKRMAITAREQVQRLLARAKYISLREMGRDKYFRIVARVVADGVDVGELLIREGVAVSYDGGSKTWGWCNSP